MRSLFLLLLLANLLFVATQFAPVRNVLLDTAAPARAAQLNAAKLRIIRDTSLRPIAPPSPVAPATPQPSSGTNS